MRPSGRRIPLHARARLAPPRQARQAGRVLGAAPFLLDIPPEVGIGICGEEEVYPRLPLLGPLAFRQSGMEVCIDHAKYLINAGTRAGSGSSDSDAEAVRPRDDRMRSSGWCRSARKISSARSRRSSATSRKRTGRCSPAAATAASSGRRAEDRNRDTAKVYDRLGLPEFYALEAFVQWRDQ